MNNINPNGTDIEPDGPDDDDIIDMAWKVANAQGVLPIDDVSINSHLLNKVIEIAKETVELRDTLLQREERLTEIVWALDKAEDAIANLRSKVET